MKRNKQRKEKECCDVEESNKLNLVLYFVCSMLCISLCVVGYYSKRLTDDTVFFLIDTFYYKTNDDYGSESNKTSKITIDNGHDKIELDAPKVKSKEDADKYVKALAERAGLDSSKITEK